MIAPWTEIDLYIKNVNNEDNKNYFLERKRDFEKIFLQERKLLEYENTKNLINNFEENYTNNLILFEETIKQVFIENEEKRVLSQTYILCDDAGTVKPTYISKLEWYVNIFSKFMIF